MRDYCASVKVVVLLDGLGDVPRARHAVGEDDIVAGLDLGRLAAGPLARWRHEDLALEHVGALRARVLPV